MHGFAQQLLSAAVLRQDIVPNSGGRGPLRSRLTWFFTVLGGNQGAPGKIQ